MKLQHSCRQQVALPCGRQSCCLARRALRLQCSAERSAQAVDSSQEGSRRHLLQSCAAAVLATSLLPQQAAQAGKSPDVGSYLPPSSVDGLVEFVPDAKKTPALRAGVIKATDAYKFSMPPTFKEVQVANIQSGNFCMPNCAEPWTEVVFADDKLGKVMVMVSPLEKLTFKKDASIKDIGNTGALLNSFGPYITGTQLEEEDVVSQESKDINGRTYYEYEAAAPYATNGTHQLARVVTKGKCAFLFVACANDKQWPKAEKLLRQSLETFTV